MTQSKFPAKQGERMTTQLFFFKSQDFFFHSFGSLKTPSADRKLFSLSRQLDLNPIQKFCFFVCFFFSAAVSLHPWC